MTFTQYYGERFVDVGIYCGVFDALRIWAVITLASLKKNKITFYNQLDQYVKKYLKLRHLRQINKTALKSEKKRLDKHEMLETKPGHCSLEAFHKFPRSLQRHWNVHFIYSSSELAHQVFGLTTYTICRRGEKSLVDSPLSLSQTALGVWLLPCQCFPPLQALRAFHLAKVQGQPLLSSSQPLLPIRHAHTHVDFHFSYSARLAAPPPQGWLKEEGRHPAVLVGCMRGRWSL